MIYFPLFFVNGQCQTRDDGVGLTDFGFSVLVKQVTQPNNLEMNWRTKFSKKKILLFSNHILPFFPPSTLSTYSMVLRSTSQNRNSVCWSVNHHAVPWWWHFILHYVHQIIKKKLLFRFRYVHQIIKFFFLLFRT